jgi:hypothetical protein
VCGEGEVECRVGEGEEVIISISSSSVRLLPNKVRGEKLVELAWARKARAYLNRRASTVF